MEKSKLTANQQKEIETFRLFFNKLNNSGIYVFNQKDGKYIKELFNINHIHVNEEKNGNYPPDIYLDCKKEVGLEIFSVSLYNKITKKSKTINIKRDLSTKKTIQFMEKNLPYNKTHIITDESVSQKLKHDNYSQDLEEFVKSTISLIEKHYKTFKNVQLNKKGFLIYMEEVLPISYMNHKGKLEQDKYCIFNDKNILNVIKRLEIDFWLFMTPSDIYFFKKDNNIDVYPEKILPIYMNAKILFNYLFP